MSAPSTSNSSSAQLVSASAYLHLAPPGLDSTHSTRQIRQLVLDYLSANCYPDTAKAFARQVDKLEGVADTETAADDKLKSTAETTNAFKRDLNGEDEMEGVEATPPPESWPRDPDAVQIEFEGVVGELNGSESNGVSAENLKGKSVAFEAAEEFDSEQEEGFNSSLLSTQELKMIRKRREIRDAILSGRISLAIDLIQQNFPNLLAEPKQNPQSNPGTNSFFAPKPAPIKPNSTTPTTLSRDFFVPTPSASSLSPLAAPFRPNPVISSNPKPSLPTAIGAHFPESSQILSPTNLNLLLGLQSFVELMRNIFNNPSRPGTPNTPSGTLNPTADTASDCGMSASNTSIGSNSTSIFNLAISQSQRLNSKVLALANSKDKEVWAQECVNVSGLMAYKDLNGCPLKAYLDQSKRQTLSEIVNAAILVHEGKPALPLLNLAVRHCSTTWASLADFKLQFPPVAPNLAKEAQKNGKIKTYPKFDLRTFLAEREVVPTPK